MTESMHIPDVELQFKGKFQTFEHLTDKIIDERIIDQIAGSIDVISKPASLILDRFILNELFNRFDLVTANPSYLRRSQIKVAFSLDGFVPVALSNIWPAVHASDSLDLLDQMTRAKKPDSHTRPQGVWSRPALRMLNKVTSRLKLRRAPSWMVGEIFNYTAPMSAKQRLWEQCKFASTCELPIEPIKAADIPTPSKAMRAELKAALFKILRQSYDGQDIEALSRYLAISLPVVLLEDRRRRFLHILSQFPQSTCLGFVTFNYWFGETDTFCMAVAKHLHKKIIINQHGGYYGYRFHHGFAILEFAAADYYLTWGWQKNRLCDDEKAKATAEFIPSGSFYLDSLRRSLGSSITSISEISERSGPQDGASPKSIAYLPTSYLEDMPHRYDLPFLEWSRIKPEVTKSLKGLFELVAANGLSLSIKFSAENEAFKKLTHELAANLKVCIDVIPSNIRAYELFKSHDLILWDTVGTGFMESNTLRKPTFLLPSARFFPTFSIPSSMLSEHFFIGGPHQLDFYDRYQKALGDSRGFFDEFGACSKMSLHQYLHQLRRDLASQSSEDLRMDQRLTERSL